MDETPAPETFAQFKDSFFYGSRTDLNFKFLRELDEEEAGRFFQGILAAVGRAVDSGETGPLADLVVDWQARAFAEQKNFAYDTGPFTPPAKPLSETRLTLLGSSGHFVDGDDPRPFGEEGLTQAGALARVMDFLKLAPTLSAIPFDTPPGKLRVRHPGYDIAGAEADPNVNLPLERLRELQAAGLVGQLTADAYSFVGVCSQTRLLKQAGPAWVDRLREDGVEAALLVPV